MDLERLRVHLAVLAEQARSGRRSMSLSLIGGGIGLAGLALATGRLPEERRTGYLVATLTTSGLVTGLGAASLLLVSPQERLLADLEAASGPSAERALTFERRFAAAARQARVARQVSGGVAGALGLLLLGRSLVNEVQTQARGAPDEADTLARNTLVLFLGGMLTGAGIADLFFTRTSMEAAWERYAQDPAVKARRGSGPDVQVGAGPMGRDGFGLALAGRF